MINKHTHAINVDHVQYAISKLKSGKSDCVANLYSDNFEMAQNVLLYCYRFYYRLCLCMV